MHIILSLFLLLFPLTASAEPFFNDVVISKKRSTDLIKFKIELQNHLQEVVKLKTKQDVKASIDVFMLSNKSKFKPFLYNFEEDGDETDFTLFLTVYYDSYKFESFNLIHFPSAGTIGVNVSDELKERLKDLQDQKNKGLLRGE